MAPIRNPPSAVGSVLSSPRRVTSIKRVGASTSSFIKSRRLVPPAMNFAPGWPPATAIAALLGAFHAQVFAKRIEDGSSGV